MPWFKVDDGLHSHPKWLALARLPRARALWVTAGSWCAANLTDGHVPRHVLGALGGRPADAAALVEVGLWDATDGGWRFHGWDEFQPSAEKVKAERKATADRVARWREQKRNGDGGNGASNAVTPDACNGVSNAAPGPARPGPAQTPLLTLVGRLAVGDASASLPADIVALWQDRAGPGVDLEHEARRYLERNLDRPAKDERAAWLGWLDRAREHAPTPAAPARTACPDSSCLNGWLMRIGDPPDAPPRPCPRCKPHLTVVPDTDPRPTGTEH